MGPLQPLHLVSKRYAGAQHKQPHNVIQKEFAEKQGWLEQVKIQLVKQLVGLACTLAYAQSMEPIHNAAYTKFDSICIINHPYQWGCLHWASNFSCRFQFSGMRQQILLASSMNYVLYKWVQPWQSHVYRRSVHCGKYKLHLLRWIRIHYGWERRIQMSITPHHPESGDETW